MKRIRVKRMSTRTIGIYNESTARMDLPDYATTGSAGMDLRAAIHGHLRLWPNKCEVVPTGIAIDMTSHPGLCALIFARSGLATKHLINLANGVGLIDNDYQGEIKVALMNNGHLPITIKAGMRIAQLVFFSPELSIKWEETDTFEESGRGTGGFGSTGTE